MEQEEWNSTIQPVMSKITPFNAAVALIFCFPIEVVDWGFKTEAESITFENGGMMKEYIQGPKTAILDIEFMIKGGNNPDGLIYMLRDVEQDIGVFLTDWKHAYPLGKPTTIEISLRSGREVRYYQ
jgi:hypothetical protein